MKVFHGAHTLPSTLQGGVMTLGNFDGIHVGHQQILRQVVRESERRHLPSLVYTFDPHPAKVLAPKLELAMIQTLSQRLDTFARSALQATVVEPFTHPFADMEAGTFCDTILGDCFAPSHLIVGYDLTYGRHRMGRTTTLAAWCLQRQIDCSIIEPVFVGDVLISSTYIRRCIASGNVAEAQSALGRPFALIGDIVRGHGIGQQLGFPTLNMMPHNELVPIEGVYVTSARLGSQPGILFPAATYIGRRPTFGGTAQVVETYLLEGTPGAETRMTVDFHHRLRGDIRFDTAEALRQQITDDVAAARTYHETIDGRAI